MDSHENQIPDQPGIYFVVMYLPLPDGMLSDETTTRQYRARNELNARARAKSENPGASIVQVDFQVDEIEDDENEQPESAL